MQLIALLFLCLVSAATSFVATGQLLDGHLTLASQNGTDGRLAGFSAPGLVVTAIAASTSRGGLERDLAGPSLAKPFPGKTIRQAGAGEKDAHVPPIRRRRPVDPDLIPAPAAPTAVAQSANGGNSPTAVVAKAAPTAKPAVRVRAAARPFAGAPRSALGGPLPSSGTR